MKTEKTLWIIFILAFILRLLDFPGYGMLTILSLCTLAMIYFPGSIYFFSDKKFINQNQLLSVFTGVGLAVIPIAITFRLQHWPGQIPQLGIGIFAGVASLAATYILRKKSPENLKGYYRNMHLRTSVLTIAILFFTLLPPKIIVQVQHHNDPELIRLKSLAIDNPDNRQYWDDVYKYRRQKDSLEFTREHKK